MAKTANLNIRIDPEIKCRKTICKLWYYHYRCREYLFAQIDYG